jgi:ATP-dependent DNA helicase DinG
LTFDVSPKGQLTQAVRDALSAEGPIAASQPDFVARPGQLQLAQAIAEAIETQGSLIAEAGTGTGKTFAYLVPALLAGARVLISTGTRNLQDQLFDRDLPQMLRVLGVNAEIALLKGRSNYVCRYHLKRNLAEGRFGSRQDIADLRRIERFAVVSSSGDRASLPGVPEEATAWNHAVSTRENCLGQDCPDYERCFVMKARQAAQRADVIVVNHHLFCADLALREEGVADLLPTTEAIVFDEAHQLPEVATQFFGSSVSTRRLLDFSRDLLRSGLAEARDACDWTLQSQSIEQSVRELRLAAGAAGRLDARAAANREGLLSAIESCANQLGELAQILAANADRGRELQRCAIRGLELRRLLERWVRAAKGEDSGTASLSQTDDPHESQSLEADSEQDAAPSVIWAEIFGSGLTLHSTPLSVAPTFKRHLEGRPRAWVFLSATLAVNGGFDHFRNAIGVDQGPSLVWESPFDYQSQALLYVPEKIGPPSGPDFPERVFQSVWPLVQGNDGRAFILCTTLRMVDQLASRFRTAIEQNALQIGLLVQGEASRAQLLEQFRRHPAPVLIGSSSFWEGVDVPGAQLSLVVIDKLPFAPPDEPILGARIEAARKAGQDPFRSMQLPGAAMALKQGAGRLIRSERDRGLLVVCDARLAEKAYGRTLLRSLPPFRRTRSAQEALDFIDAQRNEDRALPTLHALENPKRAAVSPAETGSEDL